MKLTEEQTQRFRRWLDERWGMPRKECTVCGMREWGINDSVFELREFFGPTTVLGHGKLFPVIPVTCSHCGNTVFFNAIPAGIVSPGREVRNDK